VYPSTLEKSSRQNIGSQGGGVRLIAGARPDSAPPAAPRRGVLGNFVLQRPTEFNFLVFILGARLRKIGTPGACLIARQTPASMRTNLFSRRLVSSRLSQHFNEDVTNLPPINHTNPRRRSATELLQCDFYFKIKLAGSKHYCLQITSFKGIFGTYVCDKGRHKSTLSAWEQ
jgi:hypothetical protein